MIDLFHRVTPWTTKSHIKKVNLLSTIFLLKKLTSPEYYLKRKRVKRISLVRMVVYRLINYVIDLRLKYKFYHLPVEKILFDNYLVRK